MRVSTSYQYDSFLRNINSARAKVYDAQQEILTGKKHDLLTKDPSGGVYVLRASSIKSSISQYDANLRSAKDYLNTTEGALNDTTDVLKSAYSIALQAANSTTDQTARNALATSIAQLQSRLVSLANTQGGSGQYVFGGQLNSAAPFSVSAGALTYAGDSNNVVVETSAGQTMAVNSQGQPLLSNAYAALEQLRQHLVGGNISAISGQDVQALQSSMDAVKQERGAVGARLNTVTEIGAQNQRRIDDLTSTISDVEDVDMASAITKYQLAETAYQAALQVSSKGYNLSLMDFIR